MPLTCSCDLAAEMLWKEVLFHWQETLLPSVGFWPLRSMVHTFIFFSFFLLFKKHEPAIGSHYDLDLTCTITFLALFDGCDAKVRRITASSAPTSLLSVLLDGY